MFFKSRTNESKFYIIKKEGYNYTSPFSQAPYPFQLTGTTG